MAKKGYMPEQMINKIREAKVLIEDWRREYNQRRPRSALGYRTTAPETIELPA